MAAEQGEQSRGLFRHFDYALVDFLKQSRQVSGYRKLLLQDWQATAFRTQALIPGMSELNELCCRVL